MSQEMLQLEGDLHVGTADPESDSHQVSLQTDLLSHNTACGKHELLQLKQSLSIEHPELSSSVGNKTQNLLENRKTP
jgi:hypothetical protein